MTWLNDAEVRTVEDKALEKLEAEKATALQYLNSTDWYVTRNTETGKEIPEDVIIKRAEARSLI